MTLSKEESKILGIMHRIQDELNKYKTSKNSYQIHYFELGAYECTIAIINFMENDITENILEIGGKCETVITLLNAYLHNLQFTFNYEGLSSKIYADNPLVNFAKLGDSKKGMSVK